jgi:hypothetical protein
MHVGRARQRVAGMEKSTQAMLTCVCNDVCLTKPSATRDALAHPEARRLRLEFGHSRRLNPKGCHSPRTPLLTFHVSRLTSAFGSSIQNRLPLPGSDSTPTRPPIRSTPFLTIASPKPVPA